MRAEGGGRAEKGEAAAGGAPEAEVERDEQQRHRALEWRGAEEKERGERALLDGEEGTGERHGERAGPVGAVASPRAA